MTLNYVLFALVIKNDIAGQFDKENLLGPIHEVKSPWVKISIQHIHIMC